MTFKLPETAFTILDNEGPSIPVFTADQVLAAYEQGRAAELEAMASHIDAERDAHEMFRNHQAVYALDSILERIEDEQHALKESASRAIQAPEEGESLRQCEVCCGSGIIKHDEFNPTQSTCDCCNGEGRVTDEDLAAWQEGAK